MSRFFAVAVCFAGSLTLAACGGAPDDPASEAAGEKVGSADGAQTTSAESAGTASEPEIVQPERPAAIAQCIACHTFEEDGPNRIGPNLWGVYGQPAAAKSGFAYSSALMNSDLTWDDAALDAYLENPRKAVPGGKMSYAGMRDEEQRKQVISFLATLTESD